LTSTTNGPRNFPPYDIIEQEDGKVRIELAAAGYTKEQLNVEKVGNTLLIKGSQSTKKETIRHKGLYSAAWQRAFELQPNALVEAVKLENGLLTVVVATEKPAEKPRTTFEIK
jgi:molecular chaperone IbpA